MIGGEFTAENYREVATQISRLSFKRELQSVKKDMEEARDNGETNITRAGSLSLDVSEYLRQRGFKVSQNNWKNEAYYMISWGK